MTIISVFPKKITLLLTFILQAGKLIYYKYTTNTFIKLDHLNPSLGIAGVAPRFGGMRSAPPPAYPQIWTLPREFLEAHQNGVYRS